jgi:protein ImuB
VGYVELLDTHRPDAFRNAGFQPAMPVFKQASHGADECRHGRLKAGSTLAFRVFRPARQARVELADGQPGFVAATGIRGRVLEYAGPWRSSGDWWTNTAWQRDEWDIALSDGVLYRLFCSPQGWFVEGSYD